jgi:hypothetical protein
MRQSQLAANRMLRRGALSKLVKLGPSPCRCCPQENRTGPKLSSHNVAAADPNSLTILPCPVSRSPDVIRAAHIIARAASIVRPIANRDRDGAWVSGIAWTVTGSVRATAVIRPTPGVVRAPAVISSAVIIRIGASACANHDNNEQEPENRQLSSHCGFGVTGSCLRFPMINTMRFHTFIIRIRPNFCALPLR